MRRSVHQDEILSEADERTERAKVTASPGPDVPCFRWDEATKRYVPAVDAVTFCLSNLGLPGTVFFTARDTPAEEEVGKTPIFAAYDLNSGSKLPVRSNQVRAGVIESAKGFLLSCDQGQRIAAMNALRQLGRERGKP